MAFFVPKPWVNPFGKIAFFCLFKLFFYSLERRFFLFQNIAKHIFVAYFGKKKEFVKKPIFVQKPWINPFRKMAILRLFELLIFIAYRCFFVLECRKRHFPLPISPKKKKLDKWPFLDQIHGVTSFEKSQSLNF